MGPFVIRCMRASLLALAIALVPAATAGAASLWTQVPTNTTQTITAISAPHPGEVVFVTSGGSISFLNGSGSFQAATLNTSNPNGFTDIAMSPDGTHGVAVGNLGSIYRSSDSGVNWTKVTGTPELNDACPPFSSTTSVLSDNLYSVKWADATTVWITGARDDVLKSTNSGLAFHEANKSASGCVADPGGSSQAFTDMAWLDSLHAFFLSNNFGDLWGTTDGFAHATKIGGGANGFTYIDRLAVDPGSPNRAWAVAGGPGAS